MSTASPPAEHRDPRPLVASLIRTYTSQGAYAQDVIHLARLGYSVALVVETPTRSWFRRLQRRIGVAPTRVTVTYTDYGAADAC